MLRGTTPPAVTYFASDMGPTMSQVGRYFPLSTGADAVGGGNEQFDQCVSDLPLTLMHQRSQ